MDAQLKQTLITVVIIVGAVLFTVVAINLMGGIRVRVSNFDCMAYYTKPGDCR